jgi:hypothetical protein
MKLIHSFLTNTVDSKNIKEVINAKNWGDTLNKKRVYWYCWAWSFLSASKHSNQFELYTDSMGAAILCGAFKIPYSKVNLLFDGVDRKYMYLGKIKTYAKQTEPFLHIDGDVVFRDYFPSSLPNLYGQHYSCWLYSMYQNALILLFNNNFQGVPEEFKQLNILNMKKSDFSYLNAGVFGGTDLKLIKECADKTLLFFENDVNKKLLDDLFDNFPVLTFYADNFKSSIFTQTAMFSLFEEFLPVLLYKQKYKGLDGLKTVLSDNFEEDFTGEIHSIKSSELKYVHLMDLKRLEDQEATSYRHRFIKKFREEYPEWADRIDKYLS